MELRKKILKKILYAMRYRIGILIAFFILSFASLVIMQKILLEKAHITGQEMARSYTIEEEKNLKAYSVVLHIACQKLTDLIEKEYNEPDFEENVIEILHLIQNIFLPSKILPYAIINEKVYFINPELSKKISHINLKDTNWYERAFETHNEVIVSDAYQSAINNKMVITLAKASNKKNHIIAFDIFPENFKDSFNTNILPPHCYYYLCDQRGKLLYTNATSLTPEQMEKYIPMIINQSTLG